MALEPEIQGMTIVVRGKLNPAQFQPHWFADHKLFRRDEAGSARIQIIHPAAVTFSIAWLDVNVDDDRFQIGTGQQAYFDELRDVSISSLDRIDNIEPRMLGLNRTFHYGLPSEKEWHQIGHRLVQKQDWETVMENPGTLSVYLQGTRGDDYDGYIRIKAELSTRVVNGVFIDINDHYELTQDVKNDSSRRKALDILGRNWDASMRRSHTIAEKIISWGLEQ